MFFYTVRRDAFHKADSREDWIKYAKGEVVSGPQTLKDKTTEAYKAGKDRSQFPRSFQTQKITNLCCKMRVATPALSATPTPRGFAMFNLCLSSAIVLTKSDQLSSCRSIAIDCNTDKLWTINNDLILVCIDLTAENKVTSVVMLKDHLDQTTDDCIIGLECLSEMNLVTIATTVGELLTCNTITEEVEEVGVVDSGIKCISWSPDQDIVVMVTGNHTLLLMTRDFDSLTEVPIESQEFGEAQPVTVGWGKKETQFHGSLGKQSAKQSSEKPIAPAGSWDDHTPLITWRGDGEYFACSTIDTETGGRLFRVWSREGSLYSTCEPTPGLERPISWRPSGDLIASVRSRPQGYEVALYESNGLSHGMFPLPRPHQDWIVIQLQWNVDSSVLGVWLERKTTPRSTTVQLWATKNYHWYLKQEFRPITEDHTHSAIAAMLWDPLVPLKLHLLTTCGQYMSYTWCRRVSGCGYLSSDNTGAVAVIDGDRLLWTPFRHVTVPPPMCAHEVSLPCPAHSVAFAPPPNPNNFVVLLTSGRVLFVQSDNVTDTKSHDTFRSVTTPPKIIANSNLIADDAHYNIHDLRWIMWISTDTIVGVSTQSCDKSCDLLQDVVIEYTILPDYALIEKSRTVCNGRVLCCHGNHDTGTIVVEYQDGSVYQYTESTLVPWINEAGQHVTFGGVACEQLDIAKFGNKECVVALNVSRRQLFVNNFKVSACCTSFVVHDEFVLMTTDSHTLRVLPTDSLPNQELGSDIDPAHPDESFRRVERGSLLVTAIPSDFRVVLQMPRGNIETVCPRALVLGRVRSYLDRLLFQEAYSVMRKHRLNLNFICDHNMDRFLGNARLFIQQINDVNLINIFLNELKAEDVTQTMYPTPSWYGDHTPWNGNQSDKVNVICDTLRTTLEDIDSTKYSLCVITARVKKSPSELEAAMAVIKGLKDEVGRAGGVARDDALKYLSLLVDVNKLYDVALGMYDFELVLQVAKRSQKDPKEYLPFLNDLKKLPESYCKFKINLYLKRHLKALHSIIECGPERFEECLTLIKEHKLYKEALECYKCVGGSHERHVIGALYADWLFDNKHYKEAATVYEGCGQLEKALPAYKGAGLWRQALVMSAKIGHTKEERNALVNKIIVTLKSRGCYGDAARLLLDYIDDPAEAVVMLIEGKEWAESIRIIHLHNIHKLIEDILKPSLLEAHQSQVSYLEQQTLLFQRHVTRLGVVRREKEERALSGGGVTSAIDERDVDLFSDVTSATGVSTLTSVSSRMSRATNKTAKSRKKSERKKYSLKEGSAHEDVALTEALKHITELSNGLHGETCELLLALSSFGYEEEARGLQESLSLLLDTVRNHYKEVWPQPAVATPTDYITDVRHGPASSVNDIVASMQSQRMPATHDILIAPVLKNDDSWKLTCL